MFKSDSFNNSDNRMNNKGSSSSSSHDRYQNNRSDSNGFNNQNNHYNNGNRTNTDSNGSYSRNGNGHRDSSSSSNPYKNSSNSRSNNYQAQIQPLQQAQTNQDSNSMNHSALNRLKQLNKLEEIKNLPRPNWSNSSLKPFEKQFYRESSIVFNRSQNEVNDYLQTNNITMSGSRVVKPILDFNELDIPKMIVSKISDMKFDRPTLIQSMCWPTLLSGNDMVGIAQTGSGKTFGFVLPMIIHIMNNQRYIRSYGRDDTPGPIALVVAPTRELAIQIQQVAEEFGSQVGLRNIVIYGGSPKQPQLQQIKRGADIYIATPGRLIDFVKDNSVSLNRCTYLVLDEADRMLDMGFEPQIRKIIEQIRPDRQTAMFSATWPKEVRKLAEDFITDYLTINIGIGDLTANPNIRQIVEVCQEHEKENRLREILNQIMNNRDSKAIVFAETKKKVDTYSKFMQNLGFYCLTIHGDKKQMEREWVLNEFRKKPKSILCATDVAARGLNISDIKYVINIDYPMQTEDYIHRIGRTARSTNSGTSFTFITNDNSRHLPKLIEILRKSNQFVSDSILNLARINPHGNGFKNGQNRNGNLRQNNNLQPKFNNYNNNNNQEQYASSNHSYKRSLNEMNDLNDSNNNRNENNGGEVKRIKKNRWDDGSSVQQVSQIPLPSQNGSYQNGNSYGIAYPLMNNPLTPQSAPMPLIPPVNNQHHHIQATLPPPPPPPTSAPQAIPQPLLASAMYPAYNNYY